MKERKIMKLASEGKRFGAFCIDMLIPAAVVIMITILFSILMFTSISRTDPFGFGYPYPFDYGYGYGKGNSLVSGGVIAVFIIALLLSVAYIAIQLFFFSRSKTLGKAAMGLMVVSSIDGKPVGFWKMIFREWFVKQASAFVFLLGFIWVLIDEKNRGWHDKILDTYVVDVRETEAIRIRQSVQSTPAPKSAPLYRTEVSDPVRYDDVDADTPEEDDMEDETFTYGEE